MNNLLSHTVEPQDLAFDAFRDLFPINCTDVSADGLKMTYRGNLEFLSRLIPIAHTIIIANCLPLEARMDKIGIVIEFFGAESLLPCY